MTTAEDVRGQKAREKMTEVKMKKMESERMEMNA